MTFESPFPPVRIPDTSVFDYVFAGADAATDAADADRPAFVDAACAATVSFREMRDRSTAFAGELAALGIQQGAVVALHAPNSAAFGVAFHGILRTGASVTTVPLLATANDVAKQLTASGAVAMLADPALTAAAEGAVAAGLPASRILTVHPDLGAGHADAATLPPVTIDPATHVAALPYSSGTTGIPKGVKLSHRNLVANLAQIEDLIGVTRDDVVIAVLPFFHIYGMTVLLNLGLRRRATLVTMPRFDLTGFLEAIARYRVTVAFIAPPIAVALAKHPAVGGYDLSSLRILFSGAAPLDGELGRALTARLGARVVQGYGMSELSPVSHLTPTYAPNARKLADLPDVPCESVGYLLPNTVNLLLDPASGKEIPKPVAGMSERGELCIKGPNVMLGYLDNAAATDAMIDADGFLHTGDVATVDAEGRVYIVDRIKELIKYKGYQVAPSELEALLLTHPSIADAAVIGIIDESGEEVPKAFVVRKPDTAAADLTEDHVMAYVAERVAPYKKVRRVEFLDAVPKSASGKILRRELRDRENEQRS